VVTCPACGKENPEGFQFCGYCSAPLTEQPAPSVQEERKVVTVLFCDLVGFTARAEALDPEDVRRVLQPYHAQVRSELEHFGGTVEKFIGDAVMALFGAPVAHEDDPERAVRAALAVRDAVADEDGLDVRIGITTGEALVALGARPEEGEGMASGDVVNTAARLQAAAPVNGILVDETTFRATERTISYREAAEVEAKGKADPVEVREAVEAKSRLGVDVRQLGARPLVGRSDELDALLAALNRARRAREPQLVTLVGVPGIGKSRLVWELFQRVDAEGELTWWRQGRSLPYGEGVSFWALAEIVKGQAGVLETDTPAETAAKLREMVASLVSDPADARWVEAHLRPLVGLETSADAGAGGRDEAFAAWRRFLESLAEQRSLVLVFEDLHWADDALLDFVDYLVEWGAGVPILVVGTARPELLSRRPGWGGGKPNAMTLSLAPLSDDETTHLIHGLLERSVLDADVQRTLLERASGNPLYAEEFVRMLRDRVDGDVVLPETVQGLIAARLDGLESDEKALLQAAAVLGKVFWLGAAAELAAAERWSAETLLHLLERKEFVRRERQSSVASESEYAFRHLLVRDVAYGQIPRGVRAHKHRVAARWIESLGRPEDHAEMLAHHYAQALELSRAAGESTEDIAAAAAPVLVEAGDRAFSLNSYESALRFWDEALGLEMLDPSDTAEVTFRRARALHRTGAEELEVALQDARAQLLALGNVERVAEAETLLAEHWFYSGDRAKALAHLDQARRLVESLPISAEKAHVLSQTARFRMLADENEEAVEIAHDVLKMAEALELDELQTHALTTLGTAKVTLGDLSGLQDLEHSIEMAIAARSSEASRASNNLGAAVWGLGDIRRTRALSEQAIQLGERFGNAPMANYARILHIQVLFQLGEWDEAVPRMDDFIAACEEGQPHYLECNVRRDRAFVRLARGDSEGALDDAERALAPARRAADPQALIPTLTRGARIYAEAGRIDAAKAMALECLATKGLAWALPDLGWIARDLDVATALEDHIERMTQGPRYIDVARALLRRDFVAAAELFHEIGDAGEEALARLRAAEQLVADGQRADEQLQRSLSFWRSVGATRYIREGEALLGEGEVAAV